MICRPIVALVVCVICLTGCLSIELWDNAPRVRPDRITGAALDADHVLHVQLHFSDGTESRYLCALAGTRPLSLQSSEETDALEPYLVVHVPPLPPGSSIHDARFVVGDSIQLRIAFIDELTLTSLKYSQPHESVLLPDRLDWREPSNYGRLLVTLPAAAIDIVTFPIQAVFFLFFFRT